MNRSSMLQFFRQLGLMIVIVGSGTIIDWIVHSSSLQFYVEPEYYLGKIIFGIVWGLIALWALKRLVRVSSTTTLAVGVPATIALFLQTKYFYQGYNNFFVFLFLVLHFFMFLPGSFWAFKKHSDALIGDPVVGRPTPVRWAGFVGLILLAEFAFFVYFIWILNYPRF